MTDENRTHNHQNHNLELYQLSYCQHFGCPGRDRTCDVLINSQMFYRWTTGQLWKFYFLWIFLNQFFQFLFREITESRNTLTVSLLHITGGHFFIITLGTSKSFVTVTCDETRITFFVTCWSHIRHNILSLELWDYSLIV